MKKSYSGGCHCGDIRYDVSLDIQSLVACNCSICAKKGHLLAFAPEADFKLLSGENSLSDYQFGKMNIHHFFCKKCGIGSFGKGTMPDGTKIAAINVRCLDDVDIDQFPITPFDGKSLPIT